MKKVLIGSALLLSVAATSAFAAPKWDQVTATYSSFEVGIVDFGGFGVSGTKLVTPNVFVEGSLSTASEDLTGEDVTLSDFSLGLGYRHALNNTTDIFGVVSFEDAELEDNTFGAESDNGFGLKGGVRSMVTPQLELAAEVRYVEIEEFDDVTFAVSGDYFFTNQFSVGVEFSTGYHVINELFEQDAETFSLSASYSF